jgi:hypothetical protein
MPTNKLWLEHTERAAWDSVEALREKLLKAEGRLQALAQGIHSVPQLLDALDLAKQKYAPGAKDHASVVAQLLSVIERQQSELEAAKAPEPTQVSFVSARPLPRPRLDSDELDVPARGHADDEADLSAFAQAMQRRGTAEEATRDLNRLLSLAEHKLDDLTELEGPALREAAVELAILAARISAASKQRG